LPDNRTKAQVKRILLAAALLFPLLGAGYKIVQTYPHDPHAYTQGLVYADGFLYEGTGQYNESSLRKVELSTGKVVQRVELPGAYFGEGIVLWKDKIIQLTWQSRIGFVYDRATFRQLRTFTYSREGWGITHDGKRLIMSDGSSSLFFWDPETLQETGKLDVSDKGSPVTNLNELEYIHGEIYANVYQTDRIARISPKTGSVLGWIDLTGLLPASEKSRADVLNGIAYDAKSNRLFVTGKWWPKLFEIRVP
jgi:glutaminyl-peptide cyclotransferase